MCAQRAGCVRRAGGATAARAFLLPPRRAQCRVRLSSSTRGGASFVAGGAALSAARGAASFCASLARDGGAETPLDSRGGGGLSSRQAAVARCVVAAARERRASRVAVAPRVSSASHGGAPHAAGDAAFYDPATRKVPVPRAAGDTSRVGLDGAPLPPPPLAPIQLLLGRDALLEVFLRLPPRDAARCAAVCRQARAARAARVAPLD